MRHWPYPAPPNYQHGTLRASARRTGRDHLTHIPGLYIPLVGAAARWPRAQVDIHGLKSEITHVRAKRLAARGGLRLPGPGVLVPALL